MWRAVLVGVSAVIAAVVGIVTAVVTAHPSRALWVSLGSLVIVGAVLQAALTRAERRQDRRVEASGSAAVAIGGSAAGKIPVRSASVVTRRGRFQLKLATESPNTAMFRRKTTRVSGDAAVGIGGDSYAPVTTTYIGTQIIDNVSVPLAAAVRDPRPVFAAAGVENFTGREWLTAEVDRFMATNPCGYVFVEAEAGLGETAFVAWLVKARGCLSHFSRYSDGTSVRSALGNLSAQLIIKFGLEDLTQEGMLQEWARTPGGFESLLAEAAEQAREQQLPLILVVDGLDEAETPPEGLPFGLPLLLPAGMFVIGTYRTGRSPKRPDAPFATLLITKRDPRNWDDLREFLAGAAGEEVLAARLAEAQVSKSEFTSLLAERCGGVWVYLRYVLDELRLGLRKPSEISELPAGLRNYYADQIHRWQRDPAWHTGLLPLLATLSAAREALPAMSLAQLAGNVDGATVQRWCNRTLRPMLTTTRTHPAGTLRYEIYHASFREL